MGLKDFWSGEESIFYVVIWSKEKFVFLLVIEKISGRIHILKSTRNLYYCAKGKFWKIPFCY